MFNPTIFENSRPEGLPTLEIESGAEKGEAQPRLFVPLRRRRRSALCPGNAISTDQSPARSRPRMSADP